MVERPEEALAKEFWKQAIFWSEDSLEAWEKLPSADREARLASARDFFNRQIVPILLSDEVVEAARIGSGVRDARAAVSTLQRLSSPPPYDSQGEQGRCRRCGGRREIEREVPHFGTEEDDWIPCPDCNPASVCTCPRDGRSAQCPVHGHPDPASTQCPTCGSGDRFVVQGECASDSHDSDPWHRGPWHRGIPAPTRSGTSNSTSVRTEQPDPASTQIEGDECDGSGVLVPCDCRPGLDGGGVYHESNCGGKLCPGCPQCKPAQPDPGGEEDWPESIYRVQVENLSNPAAFHFGDEVGDIEAVAEGWRKAGAKVRRYIPTPSQDSLGLEEIAEEVTRSRRRILRQAEDRADKAEAERDEVWELAGDLQLVWVETEDALERAETALEELAAEYERLSTVATAGAAKSAWRNSSRLAREKAAELKEGER